MLSNINQIGNYLIHSKILGEGSQSKVYLGESKSGEKVAIKVVNKSHKNKNKYQSALSEANFLNKLNSPFVSSLLATFDLTNHYYLIQKYYEGSNLQHLIKTNGKFNTIEATSIFNKILACLEYINTKGILHRDLKLANFIYYKDVVVLLDFGLACKIPKNDQCLLQDNIGTPGYMCPQKLHQEKYNSKSDIWSLGVILYELLHGALPFGGKNDQEILKDIHKKKNNIKIASSVPTNLKNIILECLTIDVTKRVEWKKLFEWKKKKIFLQNIIFEGQIENESCLKCW